MRGQDGRGSEVTSNHCECIFRSQAVGDDPIAHAQHTGDAQGSCEAQVEQECAKEAQVDANSCNLDWTSRSLPLGVPLFLPLSMARDQK